MRALEFIRDHVTFKLPYDFSYQMKNPKELLPSQYIIYQDQIFSRREKLTRIIIILGGHQLLVSKVITSSDQISL